MPDLTLRFDGGGNHIRFEEAIEALGTRRKAHDAFRRGINHTGDKARTRVVREVAKQIGLTQAKVRSLGGIAITRANFGRLEYTIRSSGRPIPLKEFGARQFSKGTKASPWGTRQMFAGAFIFAGRPNSGQFVGNGNVFGRSTSASLPIEMLFGPAVPPEMVKGATGRAFEEVSLEMGPRIGHEVARMTKGVVT